MLRFISTLLLLGLSILWLAACTSTPKKPTTTPLPLDQVQKLKNMQLKSSLPIPVHNIKAKQLLDTWAAARSHGRKHEGIDIMAPRGTKVFSATEGLIADLRNNNLGGKVVWIMGPAGTWHYYAHLDAHKRGLNVGDYVKKGDLIGYVGNTGNARHTAPHLHYGIYLDGKGRGVVNPYPYLR
ncbi:M23 family metallopeptidase [Acinetobacter bohemicus]|uniref:Peptidase family M23 n=1 Tax=Acinetobacter bohemicus TaxID=1435036 RepID=A0A1I6TBU7_9GAMM|nr:M23 family metallopeptidase [Acinetobacter bohemicus]KAB0652756.1 M23 family metallopeptidase [Acinetobacter bohemicus]SFS86650.1 Peptidase family M23 [Acinetobacter bohemicus]